MDRAAAVEVRLHLLKTQRNIATQSNGRTVTRLPKALEQHVLPTGTPIDIEIYQDPSSKCLPFRGVGYMIPHICDALRRMPISRLEYHLSLDPTTWDKLSCNTRHKHARDIMWGIRSRVISPQHNSRIRSVHVTWRLTGEGGQQPSFDRLDGFETELSGATFPQPRLYEFFRENADCGAWAVEIPLSGRLRRNNILNHVADLIGSLSWFENVASRSPRGTVAKTWPDFGTVVNTR